MLTRMVLERMVSPESVKGSFRRRAAGLNFTGLVHKQALFFADFERRYLCHSRLQAAGYCQALTCFDRDLLSASAPFSRASHEMALLDPTSLRVLAFPSHIHFCAPQTALETLEDECQDLLKVYLQRSPGSYGLQHLRATSLEGSSITRNKLQTHFPTAWTR